MCVALCGTGRCESARVSALLICSERQRFAGVAELLISAAFYYIFLINYIFWVCECVYYVP